MISPLPPHLFPLQIIFTISLNAKKERLRRSARECYLAALAIFTIEDGDISDYVAQWVSLIYSLAPNIYDNVCLQYIFNLQTLFPEVDMDIAFFLRMISGFFFTLLISVSDFPDPRMRETRLW